MANVKITELTAATALASTDVLPIVDVGADATKKVSVSNLLRNLPDGTASAPALAFADDQNSGILSPAENELAFATSGTQRLVIDSSGNVGIGTSSPSNFDSEANNLVIGNGSGDNGITIFTGSSVGDFGSIFFADSSSGGAAKKGQIRYEQNNEVMSFHTNETERLRIGLNGLVNVTGGIQVTENVTPTSGSGVEIFKASNTSGQVQAFNRTGSAWMDLILKGNTQQFHAAGSEAMRIDSSKRLLLGTTSASSTATTLLLQGSPDGASGPSYLRIATGTATPGSTSTIGQISFTDSGHSTAASIVAFRDGGSWSSSSKPTKITFSTAANGSSTATERMRIDSSGKVGVGLTSTSATLEVQGQNTYQNSASTLATATTKAAFRVKGATNSSDGLWMGVETSNAEPYIQGANGPGNNAKDILVNPFGGDVGIATTSPNFKLDVNGEVGITEGQRLSWHDGSGGRSASIFGGSGDVLAFTTTSSNTERMRIDSSGRLLVGTTSDVSGGLSTTLIQAVAAGGGFVGLARNDSSVFNGSGIGGLRFYANDPSGYNDVAIVQCVADGTHNADDYPTRLEFHTTADNASSPTERMRIASDGKVGIGTDNPGQHLTIKRTGGQTQVSLISDTNESGAIYFGDTASTNRGVVLYDHGQDSLQLYTAGSERMRINSSGNVGIGTTSPRSEFHVAGDLTITKSSNNPAIVFDEHSGSTDPKAQIQMDQENSTNASLLFFTEGSGTLSERMRITSSGDVTTTGTSTFSRTNAGFTARNGDSVSITRNGGTPLEINRGTNDGNLVNFFQGGSIEGIISVSGSTVTYGGGHLARWSQLAGGAGRTEILRGSVLSNLDEMCEWGEEDNEQLNRMKISDLEGDVNVAGVFVRWDDDDDIYTNDFYCAMTGDFVIRIAQGTTVARGDLLMSAGDGTAKPQDDDIVRSKTIAKVTSTAVSTTYADGSYCVPCVLMAC